MYRSGSLIGLGSTLPRQNQIPQVLWKEAKNWSKDAVGTFTPPIVGGRRGHRYRQKHALIISDSAVQAPFQNEHCHMSDLHLIGGCGLRPHPPIKCSIL